MLDNAGKSKDKLIIDDLLWISTYEHISVDQPTKNYIHQILCQH